MNTVRIIFIAMVASIAIMPVHASLTWSWEYTDTNPILTPTESFAAMIQILNDISSTEDLNIGGALVTLDPSWATYFTFDLTDLSSILLSPGDSTTVLYGTFNPIGVVPAGTEFDFNTSLFIPPPGGGFAPSQEALVPLHISVIPEPSSAILLALGAITLLTVDRRTRARGATSRHSLFA